MAFPDGDLQVVVKAYLGADPSDDPGTWPSPIDLSSRLLDRDIVITQGRRSGQRTAAAGSATLWLDNHDGALTPLHPSSPYYGLWDLGVPVSIDVDGVGSSPPYPRFRGYVAAIAPEMWPGSSGSDLSVVRVTAAGILRRIGQGRDGPMSPLRRAILGESPSAYWPFEDGQNTTQIASAVSGVAPLRAVGGVPVVESWAAGSLGGVDLSAAGRQVYGPTGIPAGPVASWEAEIVVGWNAPRPDRVDFLYFSTPGSQIWQWGGSVILSLDGTELLFGVFRIGESGLASGSYGTVPLDPGKPYHVRFKLEQEGSDVRHTQWVNGLSNRTGTVAGVTLYAPTDVTVKPGGLDNPLADQTGPAYVSHLAVWTPARATDQTYKAVSAYLGELDYERVQRLCTEAGIPIDIVTDGTGGVPLGPQPAASLLDLVREAERAGHGRLSESTDDWGLAYRTLRSHYNQSPSIVIDLGNYRVTGAPAPLRPVRDDARLRNRWTVSRPDGSSFTVADDDSIKRHGRYDDALTVNVQTDEQLRHDAEWRVHVGTSGGLRMPAPIVDLGANPQLVEAWLDTRPGDRIDITGLPQPHPPEDVPLLVEGVTEVLSRRGWSADLVTEPAAPFRVAVIEGAGDPTAPPLRLDTAGSQLVGAVDEDETTWSVATTDGPLWTTNAADFPFDWDVDGERVRVTAITGTMSPQTATVVRSVNSVRKAHTNGTAIALWRPAPIAL